MVRLNKNRMVWKPTVKNSSEAASALLSTACALAAIPRLPEKPEEASEDGTTIPPDSPTFISKETFEIVDSHDAITHITDGDSTDTGDEVDESECTSSDHGDQHEVHKLSPCSSESSLPTTSQAVYSIKELLLARKQIMDTGLQTPLQGSLHARHMSHAARRRAVQSTPPRSPKSPTTPLPAVSDTSWSAMQQKSLTEGDEQSMRDAETLRALKSFLNKLTIEKFDILYEKLMGIDIDWDMYTGVLASEILEKAKTQHKFIAMYADLSARFESDLHLVGSSLRDELLSQCWLFFQQSLQMTTHEVSTGTDVDEEVQELAAKRKQHMLGNIRFIGELFNRGIAPYQQLFTCIDELLKPTRTSDDLEALAALLTVIGALCDKETWPGHEQLKLVFCEVLGLTFDPSVPTRVKCLLQDVLDLRRAKWVDTKLVTQAEGPRRLLDVQDDSVHNAHAATQTVKYAFAETNITHAFPKDITPNCGMPGAPFAAENTMFMPVMFVPVQMVWPMGMPAQQHHMMSNPNQHRLQQPKDQPMEAQYAQEQQTAEPQETPQPQPQRKGATKLVNRRLKQ